MGRKDSIYCKTILFAHYEEKKTSWQISKLGVQRNDKIKLHRHELQIRLRRYDIKKIQC